MGSGKTSVGRLVADALGCPFFDLDELIVKEAGKEIPALFAEEGEAGFRSREAKLLKQTVSKYAGGETLSAVLALGGGAVTGPGAAALLRDKTLCVWLQASVEALTERLSTEASTRPLLAGEMPLSERLATLLEARGPLYEQAAQIVLDTDGATPEELADEIIISVL